MKLIYTLSFKKDYRELTTSLQNKTEQKIRLLIENISHPSLRVKKVRKYKNVLGGDY